MKKILRIVAYVMLTLLLMFLSLGLFFPTVNYETKGQVNKPLAETFSLYNDIDRIQEWIPEVKSVEKLKETSDKIGAEYRMTVVNGGQTTEMLETTEAYEENKMVRLHFDAGMMQKRDTYTFDFANGQTTIKGNHEVKGTSYYSRCVFVLFKGPFQSIDQGYLDNFVSWAEQE